MIPWSRKWQPTSVYLPGKSHEQRRLTGCSPWDRKRVRHDLATQQQSIIVSYTAISLLQKSLKDLKNPLKIPPTWQPQVFLLSPQFFLSQNVIQFKWIVLKYLIYFQFHFLILISFVHLNLFDFSLSRKWGQFVARGPICQRRIFWLLGWPQLPGSEQSCWKQTAIFSVGRICI